MKVVLDTNVYVDFAENKPEVVDLIATRSTEILLPSIVLGELLYGFMKGNRLEYNEEKLHSFIATLDVSILEVNEEVARKYAIIFSSLMKKGTPIPVNDVWIAACCMSVGGTLPTRDRHFEHIDQIDKIMRIVTLKRHDKFLIVDAVGISRIQLDVGIVTPDADMLGDHLLTLFLGERVPRAGFDERVHEQVF